MARGEGFLPVVAMRRATKDVGDLVTPCDQDVASPDPSSPRRATVGPTPGPAIEANHPVDGGLDPEGRVPAPVATPESTTPAPTQTADGMDEDPSIPTTTATPERPADAPENAEGDTETCFLTRLATALRKNGFVVSHNKHASAAAPWNQCLEITLTGPDAISRVYYITCATASTCCKGRVDR